MLCTIRFQSTPLFPGIPKTSSGQETSIGPDLENWIMPQGIIVWEWSAKNTPEQNGKSERISA
jgi:hypothetical protein